MSTPWWEFVIELLVTGGVVRGGVLEGFQLGQRERGLDVLRGKPMTQMDFAGYPDWDAVATPFCQVDIWVMQQL
jgi:hypothetical protein